MKAGLSASRGGPYTDASHQSIPVDRWCNRVETEKGQLDELEADHTDAFHASKIQPIVWIARRYK
jgi:hypothetical protein